jgi:hypothetical protein
MEPYVHRQNACPSIADTRDFQPLRAGSTCMGLPSSPLAITDTEAATVPVKQSPANREDARQWGAHQRSWVPRSASAGQTL